MKWIRITTNEQIENLKIGDRVIKYKTNIIGNGGEQETVEIDDENTTFEVSSIKKIELKRYFLKPENYTVPIEADSVNNFLSANTTLEQGYWYTATH